MRAARVSKRFKLPNKILWRSRALGPHRTVKEMYTADYHRVNPAFEKRAWRHKNVSYRRRTIDCCLQSFRSNFYGHGSGNGYRPVGLARRGGEAQTHRTIDQPLPRTIHRGRGQL